MVLDASTLPLLEATVFIGLLVLYCRTRLIAYSDARQTLGPLKTLSYPFGPFKAPGILFPTSWWNPGVLFPWRRRGTLYDHNTPSTFAMLSYLDNDKAIFSTSFDVIRQVTAPRSVWDRGIQFGDLENIPTHAYNVATAQMDIYPRHRRIVTPAFNQELYNAVWEESIIALSAMSESEGWNTQDVVTLANLQSLTSKFTLAVIAKVGFGLGLSPDKMPPATEKDMSLRDAFELVSTYAALRGALPQWVFRLPVDLLRRITAAHDYLLRTMQSHIDAHRAKNMANKPTEQRHDIFNKLLKANANESVGSNLSDDEVLSNTFIMLFAGHETSSKALSVTLGFLACHPEEQESLYSTITEVLSDRTPTIDDYDSLRPVFHCILEGLRLFPIAPIILREATEDTSLRVPELLDPIMLPKGTRFIGDIIGINYDPERFPDPESFLPSRWAAKGDLTSEDYICFGHGVHACLGRRFALYEMVCFIALFLRTWKVIPTLVPGESLQAWRKRALDEQVELGITFGPTKVPITLERR